VVLISDARLSVARARPVEAGAPVSPLKCSPRRFNRRHGSLAVRSGRSPRRRLQRGHGGARLHRPRPRHGNALETERRSVRSWVGASPEPVVVEGNDLGVAHEIAPRVDDLDVVAPRGELGRHGGPEAFLEP
jgi:hypothetical protein